MEALQPARVVNFSARCTAPLGWSVQWRKLRESPMVTPLMPGSTIDTCVSREKYYCKTTTSEIFILFLYTILTRFHYRLLAFSHE